MRLRCIGSAIVVCGVLLPAPPCHAQKLDTHFFYWYDAPGNNVNTAQMPYHPPGITSPYNGAYYSSLSTTWYEWQLDDMRHDGEHRPGASGDFA